MAITVAALGLAYSLLSPQPCVEHPDCLAAYRQGSNKLSVYAVGGLATALVLEVVSLKFSYASAKPILGLIQGVESTFMPPTLLCFAFAALLLENMVFAYSSTPWSVHAAVDEVKPHPGRPVYTIFFVEWLVNVPILLVVAGRCGLLRPLADISRPLVVTNLYIVLAWAAHFVSHHALRWTMVGVSFAMYAWASLDMMRWVVDYFETAREDAPSRAFRPLLTCALILLFGVYGLIYLSGLFGLISSDTERLFYQYNDLGSKFVMLMSFAGIRASQYHDLIITLLVNANTNFQRQAAMDEHDLDASIAAGNTVRIGLDDSDET